MAFRGFYLKELKMKKILTLLAVLLFSSVANGQWKKIADFEGLAEGFTFGEEVTCVYFLDLPGPARIGFAGTESELYKTMDGGKSWTKVWGDGMTYGEYFVTDICFMDSLTGWFSMFGGTDACYRTTDCGHSWTQLLVPFPNYGAVSAYYCSNTNRLFLGMGDTGTQVSTDLGDTWHFVTSAEAGGFSFWNDSMGIASAYPTDSTTGIMRTTNGGLNWNMVDTVATGGQPLAILGTSICFEADAGRIIIRRSDNYGQTWRVIKDFGPNEDTNFNEIGPVCTGIIRGDLSRLYIQIDSAMYVSIDEGVTWSNDGGPGSLGDVDACDGIFYCAKGITMAGSVTTNSASSNAIVNGGGLWEETWPTSGVAEHVDTASSFRVFPNPAGSSITVERASGPVAVYDPLGRSCRVPANGHTLNVSALPPGIYFLSDGASRTKFVKE